MRFLDLDLDFFLNKNAYSGGNEGARLGPEYQPWRVSRVRRFLEDRCGLSTTSLISGRMVETHDEVLGFWRKLIEAGSLTVPFEVIHIDAHPDIWIGGGLYLTSESLHIDLERGLEMLKEKSVHPGNYLTFAIAGGWIGSLVWVPLLKYWKDLPVWDGDARSLLARLKTNGGKGTDIQDISVQENELVVPFRITPWHSFRSAETFDYIALSRSPDFTSPESDGLITVIEEYMQPI